MIKPSESEQLLESIIKLLKPILKESNEVNYGIAQKKRGTREAIEFKYNGKLFRLEIKEINNYESKRLNRRA